MVASASQNQPQAALNQATHRALCIRCFSRFATFCSVFGSWKRMAVSGSSFRTLTTAGVQGGGGGG